jgi:GDPmannose 4,6-dehydratase
VRETERETTPFHPRNSYGIRKVARWLPDAQHREVYEMFCCSGILFNHESPRRGYEFVTRKITSSVARIKLGQTQELRLGNLAARRHRVHAQDYVRAMHLMLQQDAPGDYVVATGETHSVEEFCSLAFAEVGLDYRDYVRIDERFLRPAEVEVLTGDSSRAKQVLGWKPRQSFPGLVKRMVNSDLALLKGTPLPDGTGA